MIYAQILNNVIQNIIVLDDAACASNFLSGFDYCIQIDNISPTPCVGDYYDGTQFQDVIGAEPDGGYPPGIPSGSQTTFSSFVMAPNTYAFNVSVNGSQVIIGCQTYDYAWLRYALWMLLTQGSTKVNPLISTVDGVSYGGLFNFALSDAQSLYNALCTLQ